MTFSYTDTDAYPGYASKQEALRALMDAAANSPALTDILFRLNNSDADTWGDKSMYYDPAGSFGSTEGSL
jgi:hypothetical protein